MLFVIVGVLMIVLHFVGIGPTAAWNWELMGDLWKFCTPFLLAVVWWAWADGSGLTRKREMIKDQERKDERRRRNIEAMDLGARKPGSGGSRRP